MIGQTSKTLDNDIQTGAKRRFIEKLSYLDKGRMAPIKYK